MFDAEGYGSIGVAAEPGYGKPEAVRVALTRKGQRALCVGRSDLLAQQQQKGISTSASSCHGPPLTQLRNDCQSSPQPFRLCTTSGRARSEPCLAVVGRRRRFVRIQIRTCSRSVSGPFRPLELVGMVRIQVTAPPFASASRWIVALRETRSIRVDTEMRLVFFLSR